MGPWPSLHLIEWLGIHFHLSLFHFPFKWSFCHIQMGYENGIYFCKIFVCKSYVFEYITKFAWKHHFHMSFSDFSQKPYGSMIWNFTSWGLSFIWEHWMVRLVNLGWVFFLFLFFFWWLGGVRGAFS